MILQWSCSSNDLVVFTLTGWGHAGIFLHVNRVPKHNRKTDPWHRRQISFSSPEIITSLRLRSSWLKFVLFSILVFGNDRIAFVPFVCFKQKREPAAMVCSFGFPNLLFAIYIYSFSLNKNHRRVLQPKKCVASGGGSTAN